MGNEQKELFLINKHMINRYIWSMENEQKGFINDMAVDKRLQKDILDAKVVRTMFEGLEHYAVLMLNEND